MLTRLIGICGGIGSGKSVVSRMLRLLGCDVYDCDSEARCLMEESGEIKRRIHDEISDRVTDGVTPPDRAALARIVFSDERMRLKLNEIVHGAVRADVRLRAERSPRGVLFVESAILAESGLAEICSAIWRVQAGAGERMMRVMRRDGCSDAQVAERMASQQREEEMLGAYAHRTVVIRNDFAHSLLNQIIPLLRQCRAMELDSIKE